MDCNSIAEYIRAGAKPSENIGVELVHFVTGADGSCVGYYGENGMGAVLEGLARFFDEKFYSEGQLIALSNGRYHLTLEPAAQLEISIEPLGSVDEIRAAYGEFSQLIAPELEKRGLRLLEYGYMVRGAAADAPLIPKKRYEFMDRYFKSSGRYGINMMRGTASAQVSIDYSDERDCIKKFRLANALSPLFALICDNSPVFENKPYAGRMARTMIWSDVDAERCGIVRGGVEPDFTADKYAEYILNVPAIFTERGGKAVYTGRKRIGELYETMTRGEVEHVLSMVFPDVRLKNYIEIRPADSMPIEYTLSYAALVKGIFRRTDEISRAIGLDKIKTHEAENAKAELMRHGFDGEIYGINAHRLLLYLLDTAKSALDAADAKYLAEIGEIITTKTTLKDRAEAILNNGGERKC